MKTYSLLPFASLLLLAGMFTGVGIVILMLSTSSITGGAMCAVGVCFALFADYAYRGCRICEKTPDAEAMKS